MVGECGREGGLSWTARSREREGGREKERRPHGQRRSRTEAEEATGDDGIAADTHSLKSRKERGGFRQRRRRGGDAVLTQGAQSVNIFSAARYSYSPNQQEEGGDKGVRTSGLIKSSWWGRKKKKKKNRENGCKARREKSLREN